MGAVGSKVCESIASCANAFDSFLPEQKPHDGGQMREKVKKDNKTLKAENEALMLKLVRVEKEKAAALQKLEKRLARKEKLERLEAAESLEEKERIRTATIQVRRSLARIVMHVPAPTLCTPPWQRTELRPECLPAAPRGGKARVANPPWARTLRRRPWASGGLTIALPRDEDRCRMLW
jgi:hypothetical protein